jgi:hypothetical protein
MGRNSLQALEDGLLEAGKLNQTLRAKGFVTYEGFFPSTFFPAMDPAQKSATSGYKAAIALLCH